MWQGRNLLPGMLNYRVPGEDMDHQTSATYRTRSLVVDVGLLNDMASLLGYGSVEAVLKARKPLQAPIETTWSLDRHIALVLDSAESAQDHRRHPPSAIQDTATETIQRLLDALHSGRVSEEPAAGSSRRAGVVRRAIEFMDARLEGTVRILDVCKELEVSERTLHYAFAEVTGLSPKSYLKARRLNALRRDLKAADPRQDTVHRLAERWGFVHLGELAADYRRLFGELPSSTLKRPKELFSFPAIIS